jgi:arsenical pump membrane protein
VSDALAEALAAVLLAAVIASAVVQSRWLPEAAIALGAALLLVVTGVISWDAASDEAGELAPTLGFLAAMLVLADLCERDGLFAAAGAAMARAARGEPVRLLAVVFGLASVTTAVLSLDTTVVLLTPVVFATAATLRLRPRPHVLACVHLANSASLLLPVSNLSNLLALRATGLSFTRFGALMLLPWLAAIATEWVLLRRALAADLSGHGRGAAAEERPAKPPSWHVIAVLAATLAGFVAAGPLGIDLAWVAAAGAVALAVPALAYRRTDPRRLIQAAGLPFLAFVLGLGVVVRAVADHGLGDVTSSLVPDTATLPGLLATAVVAAVLANLLNNLPAILLLLPAAAAGGPAMVLAALIGVNVGPNLTYVGSLATLLWRRSLARHGSDPDLGEFVRLGALTVPPALILATVLLWLGVKVIGT